MSISASYLGGGGGASSSKITPQLIPLNNVSNYTGYYISSYYPILTLIDSLGNLSYAPVNYTSSSYYIDFGSSIFSGTLQIVSF